MSKRTQMPSSALDSLLSLYRLIPRDFRPRFFRLVATSFVVAVCELVGVASVLPLIALMLDPGALARSQLLGPVLKGMGQEGLPPLHVVGLFVITLFIFTNGLTLLVQWWSTRFSASLAVALSERLALANFRRPFTYFLGHAPTELAHKTCTEVNQIAVGGVLQLCFVIVRAITLTVVLALLIVLSPVFSLIFFALLAVLYGVSYRTSASRMATLGTRAMDAGSKAVSAATEMYAASREVLLRGDARKFVAQVTTAQDESQGADAIGRVLPTLPKYAIEIAAVCAIFAVPLYKSYMGQDVRAELPVLATFAYAGFRLLPVAQQFYAALTTLKFYVPMANGIAASLSVQADTRPAAARLPHVPATIAFEDVGFSYEAAERTAIAHVSFEIRRGERVAIVGDSGAGKSTIVDILLGLLVPASGRIRADGDVLGDGIAWNPGIVGYVPQTPLLLSDTVARNIAFGLEGTVDRQRCREVAECASIAETIERLPQGFDSVVGPGGISVSGGERQRLAIARALYGRPELLVLDEPGSALDPATSRRVFERLCGRDRDDTVVVVTHDLEHLALFDAIVFVRAGRVVMTGSYAQLVAGSAEFRAFQGEVLARKARGDDGPEQPNASA
jgi:ABC-type multidrug transport system fused ATPase/permease subunit